ncbi:MAG: hypothetical protein PHY02_07685 [Phycisphaerae bacterium]|nr:hypothetical protein [Phycisphaerae bacterium]
MKKTITKVFAIVGICLAAGGMAAGSKADSVDTVLEQLKKQTAELKSYQCRIEYKFIQPMLESETLRKGVLYYQKSDGKLAGAKPSEARSALRINFQTLKQDDEEEQKYTEQYIFDGVWLTHIDYQIKEAKRYQKAEPNEPVDAFELVGENFPIIGFSKAEDLTKEFEIGLVDSTHSARSGQASSPQVKQQDSEAENFIHLHLKVKADSIYKNDYTTIDFWVDRKLHLPAKIVAVTTEEDIYEIKFLQPKVNNKVNKKVFELKIPDGFNIETEPLGKGGQK